ncbi:hypothetical protein BIW11_14183, partial [Tropilaelaps mercedesae]
FRSPRFVFIKRTHKSIKSSCSHIYPSVIVCGRRSRDIIHQKLDSSSATRWFVKKCGNLTELMDVRSFKIYAFVHQITAESPAVTYSILHCHLFPSTAVPSTGYPSGDLILPSLHKLTVRCLSLYYRASYRFLQRTTVSSTPSSVCHLIVSLISPPPPTRTDRVTCPCWRDRRREYACGVSASLRSVVRTDSFTAPY